MGHKLFGFGLIPLGLILRVYAPVCANERERERVGVRERENT